MRKILEKVTRRLPVICGAVLMMLVLAGCSAGSTIDATLVVNKDLSGTRQMNISISEEVFQEYFTGSIEDLNALIGANCPQEMTWSYSEEGGVRQYNMEITFSSLEEYREKVTLILGEEPGQLDIMVPDTVWASGISVAESFTSQDLLGWMKDLLVNYGFVSEDNAGMIFTDGSTQVVYGDMTYNTGSRVNVSEVEYVTIESMEILTQVNSRENYSRQVNIRIPASSMNKKGEEIKAYMEGAVPTGATSAWEETEERTIFTVSAENMSPAGLAVFDTSVFISPECTISSEDVSGYFSPFTFGEHFSEHIDLSGYVAGDYSGFYVTYGVKAADSYTAYNSHDGISQDYMGWLSEDNGYYVMSEEWCSGQPLDYSMLFQKVYRVKELTVETARKPGGDLTRTSGFVLEAVPSQEEQEAIRLAIESKAGIEVKERAEGEEAGQDGAEPSVSGEEADEGQEPEAAEVQVFGETSEDGYKVVISQKGSPEAIGMSSEQVFDRAGTLSYARDREFWKVKKQEAFTENVSFGDLLENVTDDFKIAYTLKLGRFSTMEYCSNDSAEMKGGRLDMETENDRISVTYVGTTIDVLAILFWVCMAVGIICLLIALVKAGAFRKLPRIQVKQARGGIATAGTAESVQTMAQEETVPVQTAPEPGAASVQAAAQTVSEEIPVTGSAESVPQPGVAGAVVPMTGTTQQTASAPEKARFCLKCGAPRDPGAMFCEACGNKFRD